jgi:hypothetical protein
MNSPPEPERVLTDPVGVIVDIVGRVELTLGSAVIADVAEQVARSRAGRRQLAGALSDDPTLLTSGRTAGPPLVDRLIRALSEHGAIAVVQPCCATCGKTPKTICHRAADGLRICTTCHNRVSGVRGRSPCAVCGRVLIPRDYDRQGRPRCGQCRPDSGVDHIEVICDQIMALDPDADRALLRELVTGTILQRARRRQVAWDLEDRPELLTGDAAEGAQVIRRLVTVLAEHGVRGVVVPRCPFCRKISPLTALVDGTPCCAGCQHKARAAPCARCSITRPIATRALDGRPLCGTCAAREPYNQETCSACGHHTTIVSHRDGAPVCSSCFEMPRAICSVCGEFKPCRRADTAAPRCVICYRRARTAQCARCSRVRPISGRDTDHRPLCGTCAQRHEACCRCERVRPVVGRVDAGPLCDTCIRREPAHFRSCRSCGTVARLRHHGLCDRCAVPVMLDAALAGADGAVRTEVIPVRDALAAGQSVTVLNWLHRPSSRQLLAQLAAGTGPVTHDTLDQLEPAGAARHLRHVLIAQKVLPDRDRHLHALQRWFDAALAEVDNPDEQRVLRGYLTWTHLRRLRGRDTAATAASVHSIRDEIKSAIKLLTWLHDRGHSLRTCTQADLDAWCLLGGRMSHRARLFIAWCADRRFTSAVTIPAPSVSTHRQVFADEHTCWRIARHLLHSDTNTTADRVAGLLVLLYGQPVARIVHLTTDNITHAGNQVRLLLGRQPLTVPNPFDRLLLKLVTNRPDPASLGRTGGQRWLFPGRLHGQPLHPWSWDAD